MIKIILIISLILNILLSLRFIPFPKNEPILTSWDIINQKATIDFYYTSYHENIPPGFINAKRMNNFRAWLVDECTIDLNTLPPKHLAWCNEIKAFTLCYWNFAKKEKL